MATDFTEETAAEAVIESFGAQTDPRLREVLTALVQHLHAFARDVELTIPEWEQAIDFLTRTGQKCDDDRQEFILLSDVLGLSMLTETISNRKFGVATESTVLGPFHVVASPVRELGDTIDLVGTGTPCVVTGRVVSVDGSPTRRAPPSTCGRPTTRASTTSSSLTCSPAPTAGASSPPTTRASSGSARSCRATTRSRPTARSASCSRRPAGTRFRPAHIHFIVAAPGHRPLTTHIFVAGSEYIESDTVFAVKKSLVDDFEEVTDEALAEKWDVTSSRSATPTSTSSCSRAPDPPGS